MLALTLQPCAVLAAETVEKKVELRGRVLPPEAAAEYYGSLEVTVMTQGGSLLTGSRVTLQKSANNVWQTDRNSRVQLYGLLPQTAYTFVVYHSGYKSATVTYTYTQSKGADGLYPMASKTVYLTPLVPDVPGGDDGDDGDGGGTSSGGSSGGGSGGTIIVIPDTTPDAPDGPNGGDDGSTGGMSGGTSGTGGSTSSGSTGGTSSGSTGGSGANASSNGETTLAPIEITANEETGELIISREDIASSIETGRGLELVFPADSADPASREERVTVPAFTQHGGSLLESGTLRVQRVADGLALVVTVPKEESDASFAGVPHNLSAVAIERGMYLFVRFEDESERDFVMTSAQVETIALPDVDLFFLYDRVSRAASFLFAYQTAEHGLTDTAPIPAEAFTLARSAGLGLLCRIYDAQENGACWFEWIFTPGSVQSAEAADVDLYVRAAPAEDDDILRLTGGFWSQYVIPNHRGELPTDAVLRVKNLEDFPANAPLALVFANGKTLETVRSGLLPDEEGWYEWDVEQCMSFALLQELSLLSASDAVSPLRGSSLRQWLLLACAALIVLLFLLLLILLRRSREAERTEPPRAVETLTTDTEQEVINNHG